MGESTKFKRSDHVVDAYHQKLGSICPGVFAPHVAEIYILPVRNILHFCILGTALSWVV